MINLLQAILSGELRKPSDRRLKQNANFRLIINNLVFAIEDCDTMIDDLYRRARYKRQVNANNTVPKGVQR